MKMLKVWVIGNHTTEKTNYNDFALYEGFMKRNHCVTSIDFNKLMIDHSGDLMVDDEVLEAPDLAVFSQPIFTTTDDKVTLDKLEKLKSFDTTFINDVDAHWKSCSKIHQYDILKEVLNSVDSIVQLPRYGLIDVDSTQEEIEAVVETVGGFPVVLKNPISALSRGVFLCNDTNDLKNNGLKIRQSGYDSGSLIVQEYIKNKGMMLNIRAVGPELNARIGLYSPYTDIINNSITKFRRQYIPGKISTELDEATHKIMNTLSLDLARLEIFITDDGFKFCESNSIGSLLKDEAVTNLRTSIQIVDYCLAKHKARSI